MQTNINNIFTHLRKKAMTQIYQIEYYYDHDWHPAMPIRFYINKNRAQSIVKRKFKNYTNIRITQYDLINPKHFKIN